jgi:O-methyltransferase domain/Dimerisation domain
MNTGHHESGVATDTPQPNAIQSPNRLVELATAYWASRALLSAVEVGVFTALADGPLLGDELRERTRLHRRGSADFFDALVALGLLDRDDSTYRNTAETDLYLDSGKATYMGGMMEFHSKVSFHRWASLTDALRTGENPVDGSTEDFFRESYADPDELTSFLTAMSAYSAAPASALAKAFPWEGRHTFCDLGTAQGMVPVQLALRHPHLQGAGFDLPRVRPVFEEFVADNGLGSRVSFSAGDFFEDPLPPAEVYILGHILHDWGLNAKQALLQRIYDALPEGGAVLVYEMLIDDERRVNAAGLLMSLNGLVMSPDAFDFTGADCQGWMADAGFRDTYLEHLVGPESMVVGFK